MKSATEIIAELSGIYEAAVATQNDLEELLGKGIKVENVKAEQQQLPT